MCCNIVVLGHYAELRDTLVKARADGVITPEESEELYALIRHDMV